MFVRDAIRWRPVITSDNDEFWEENGEELRFFFRELRPALDSIVAIDGRNIAAYAWGKVQEKGFVDFHDFINLAPPWPQFWLEWEEQGQPVGLYVDSVDAKDEERADGVRWEVVASVFSAGKDGASIVGSGPLAHVGLLISDDGIPLEIKHWRSGFAEQEGDGESATIIAGILMFTLQFANCRNVELAEVVPPRHERRAAKREKKPVNKHYVLVIDPNTARRAYGGRKSEYQEVSRRLHICRGHFAHYTEDAPLFGKYTGNFWIPSHVRGRETFGEVVKDYSIKYPLEVA